MKKAVYLIIFIFILSNNVQAEIFSERKNLNKVLRGFYKNDIFKCTYSNKSWSVGFESHPYGMVINGSAFNNTLVFKYSNLIGTLWSNIGEISVEKGVRKYQLWKKRNGDEYELVESDYKSDLNSSDIDTKSVNNEFRTYFDKNSLKISVKSWVTDFYSCEKIESSSFARKKLIDIFVNQDVYVKKTLFIEKRILIYFQVK